MVREGDYFQVLTEPSALHAVKDGLESAGYTIEDVSFSQIAKDTVELNVEQARKLMRLIETLEDFDDVQNVYSNADIPDEAMEE